MQTIAEDDVVARIRSENPWWKSREAAIPAIEGTKPRAYFELFFPLIVSNVRRAVVLLGPRRVGKTVMIHHAIQELLARGVSPRAICYISVDHPIYNGLSIDQLIEYYERAAEITVASSTRIYL